MNNVNKLSEVSKVSKVSKGGKIKFKLKSVSESDKNIILEMEKYFIKLGFKTEIKEWIEETIFGPDKAYYRLIIEKELKVKDKEKK